AGWTPCIGPILAGIIALATTRDTVGQGSLLLALYSAGLGIPFLLTAIGLSRAVPILRWMNRHAHTVEVVSGGFLIVVGIMLFTNTFALLNAYFAWIPIF
ncbi:MAG: cytochrome c biogenesis protein CcdA, partial [Chloroflexi bacterium]|nr:cytochrome c biogenesis protein CcdA [Chloroflexota bacterium]